MYRTYYKEKFDFPKRIKIGGGRLWEYFGDTDEEKQRFFDWLVFSRAGAYMWRESADIIAISNLCNLDVEVIKVNDAGIVEYPTQKYKPDPEFPWNENPPLSRPKMILLNYSDVHFDLLAHKEAPLLKDGNLEFQEDEHTKIIEEKLKEKEFLKGNKLRLKTYKFECSECKLGFISQINLAKHKQNNHAPKKKAADPANSVQNVQTKFTFSTVPICTLCNFIGNTREALEVHMKSIHKESKSENSEYKNKFAEKSEESVENEYSKTPKKYYCDDCEELFNTKTDSEDHIKNVHTEGEIKNASAILEEENPEQALENIEFNCNECHYQAYTGPQLKKHINETGHKPNPLLTEADLGKLWTCNACKNVFSDKPDLMDHRRDNHKENRKKCKYRLKGTCIFNKDECWWSHDMTEQINLKQAPTEKEMFQCKTCEKTFQSRPETMKHRKQVHSETLPQCKSIVAGTECIFLKRGCWFNHKVETSQNADHLQSVWEKGDQGMRFEDPQTKNTQSSFFWQRLLNQEPPDQFRLMMKQMIQNLMMEIKQSWMMEIKELLSPKMGSGYQGQNSERNRNESEDRN